MKRLALSAWQGASEETKRATVQAASYGAGLLAVGPILKGVGLAVRTAFGPFSLLATAAVGGVALVVEKMGGIGEARGVPAAALSPSGAFRGAGRPGARGG